MAYFPSHSDTVCASTSGHSQYPSPFLPIFPWTTGATEVRDFKWLYKLRPGHSNRPDLNVHSILTSLCAFSCSPIFFQNIHSQLYWMLPRRVFKKYWCSIQSPYLKLSCQNRPQSLVFCKSSIWDSFVHPALSTIVVKHHTNYTSRKPPGLSIYHPPNHKPYYALLLTVWSISSLSLSALPRFPMCLVKPMPLLIVFSISLTSLVLHLANFIKTKQNKNVHGTGMFLFSSISKNFLLLRISGHQTSLPATLAWYCHSIFLEVFSNQPCSSFSSCPTTIVGGVGIYAGSLYSVIFTLTFYPPC